MRARCLLAGASLLVFANPAAAQAPPDRGAVALEEVVVTAQRRSERLQDVPLTVNTVTGADLVRAGVTTIRDLQNVVPGFTFSGQGTTAQPSIRGVSTSLSAAGSENPNALYIDGIYQTAQTLLNADLPDVARVEVLKGPQGTLFGRNATGGAIQIFTRDPSFTPTADLTAEGGYYTGSGSSRSSPHYNLHGFVAGPIIPGVLAASLSGGFDKTDGFLTNDVDGSRTGVIWRQNLRAKLRYTPTDDVTITLGAYDLRMNVQGNLLTDTYKGLSAASSYPGSVVPTQPYHTAFDPGYSVADFVQYGYTARAEVDTSTGLITYLTGLNDSRTVNYNSIAAARGSIACIAAFACIDYHFEPVTREMSQELNFASHQFGMFSFVTGAYYYHSTGGTLGIIQENLIPGGLTVQRQHFRHDAEAVYGEATIRPVDPLAIILGLRYGEERLNDESDVPPVPGRTRRYHSLTPRVSVRYTFAPELNAYFTFSQGFKSGLTGITNTAINFAAVAPEKITAYEVGLKYATSRLTGNISGFYYDYQNKQEQTFTGTSTVIRNTGPVRIYGVDADASVALSRGFTLRAAATWIPEAKYRNFPGAVGQSTVFSTAANGNCTLLGGGSPTAPNLAIATATGGLCPGIGSSAQAQFNATGMRLIRTPKLTASTTLSWEQKSGSGTWDASGTLFYSTSVKEELTGTLTQPAYAALNAQGGYRFADGVRVGIYGRNLTNKAYMVAGLSSSAAFVPNYAPPREVGVSVNYAF